MRELFALPNFFSEPFLSLGYKDITGEDLPEDFRFSDFNDLLISRGLQDIHHIDLFDPRADLVYDLNQPIPKKEYEKYQTLVDLGTLEHVFDTRQCLENCLRMVKVGGLYCLATPVKGYFKHGFHTFSPELIQSALALNNFKIIYQTYSTFVGNVIQDPLNGNNVLIWVIATKQQSLNEFVVPQQELWRHYYDQ